MRNRTAAAVAILALTAGVLTAAPSSAVPPSESDGVTITRAAGFRSSGAIDAAAANVRSGSIVFARAGNIWLVRGDGSGLYQVTRDGGYKKPSMSDNGTIVAAKSGIFVVMRQNGVVLRRFKPHDLFMAGDPDTQSLSAPTNPVISPDASKIVYAQGRARYSGGSLSAEWVTSVSSSSHPTIATINRGMEPTWLTNNRFLFQSQGAVRIANVGADGTHWFSPREIHDDYDGDLSFFSVLSAAYSPSGSRVVSNIDGTHLAISRVTGDPRTSIPVAPRAYCFVGNDATGADDAFGRVTFSPDGKSIVSTEEGKLTVLSNVDACDASTIGKVVATGASDPYWSRAALNPPPRPATKPPVTKATAKKFALKRRPKVTGKAKVGKKVKVTAGSWSARPTRITYRWYRNGKTIKGKVGAKRAYKLKKADRGKKLRVKVTVRRAGYKTVSVWSTKTKKVKRR